MSEQIPPQTEPEAGKMYENYRSVQWRIGFLGKNYRSVQRMSATVPIPPRTAPEPVKMYENCRFVQCVSAASGWLYNAVHVRVHRTALAVQCVDVGTVVWSSHPVFAVRGLYPSQKTTRKRCFLMFFMKFRYSSMLTWQRATVPIPSVASFEAGKMYENYRSVQCVSAS